MHMNGNLFFPKKKAVPSTILYIVCYTELMLDGLCFWGFHKFLPKSPLYILYVYKCFPRSNKFQLYLYMYIHEDFLIPPIQQFSFFFIFFFFHLKLYMLHEYTKIRFTYPTSMYLHNTVYTYMGLRRYQPK